MLASEHRGGSREKNSRFACKPYAANCPASVAGMKNYQRGDERIRELVSERLHDDPNIDASESGPGDDGEQAKTKRN
jgi:hypothetical protein